MNWVGGSRSRIILKQDRRKQKEYFDKKKLKSKMKLLEISSPKSSAVSLDLLNLYVVNQVTTKKDNTENMRKPVHVNITKDVKTPARGHNLELPMSPPPTQQKSNLDDLQNRLQKQILDSRKQHLSEKVKYQHNWSWEFGEVPVYWTLANIVLIFKKGKKEDPINYRPVSLTSVPGKVMEKIILGRIDKYLNDNTVISHSQHGFMRRKSCLSNLISFCNQSSQVTEQMYVGSSMEQEDNRARAFSACSLSSSGFQSSNCTQLSEENFNTNIMGNIWEQTYKEKLQNQTGNSFDQEPWNTKRPSQSVFRKSDTAPQELLEPFHRLDHMNSAKKNPVRITSNELENCEGLRAPIFDVVKETTELKASQVGSGCSFLALFEDESQQTYNNPSTKHFNLFVNQSSTDIFFIHSDVRNQMTDRNFPYNTRKAYPAINTKKSSVDRYLEGIFTAPEHVFPKSNNASVASYKETHLQSFHEGQCYFIPCEKEEKLANLEKIETFGYHHDHQINLKNVQKLSRKKCDDKSMKETAWRQNQLFGFEEFTTAGEKESKFGVSSKLHEMETDVESPLSSRSHSYPPRLTESCFSSSSGTSEGEDTANRKEYLNEQSLKTHDATFSASREVPKSFHTRTVPLHASSSLAREEVNILQEKDSIFCATEKENKNYTTSSEGSSSHRALGRKCVTRSTRCDVWSQTERCVTEVEKADVGTQCDTLRVCSCGGSLLAARSPGGVSPLCTGGTAGGHPVPEREMPQPAGAASAEGIAALPSDAEYPSLAGRRTLEVLSYIEKMKERDKH